MDNARTAEDIYFAATCIAEGKLPKSACKLLSSARLIAVHKSSGYVRPIAIGKVLRRTTAKTICCQLKQSLSKFFAQIQHDVATDGGSELVVNHICLLLESNKHWSLLKTDDKNAFNSIRRSYLMQMVYESFPEIYNHVFQMYSDSNPLFQKYTTTCSRCTLIAILFSTPMVKLYQFFSSEKGINLEDSLGPPLFSITIQHTLLELQKVTQTSLAGHTWMMFLSWG